MTMPSKLRARYSKGTLKLQKPIKLPDGSEVWVSITKVSEGTQSRRATEPRHAYPTRTMDAATLDQLVGVVSIGGDALAELA